jgi:hypothetical protein
MLVKAFQTDSGGSFVRGLALRRLTSGPVGRTILLLWTSAAVAVLGLVELFWPTPSHSTKERGRARARAEVPTS